MDADEYVGACRGLAIAVVDEIDPQEADWVMHLIDHGEAPEAMATLAWALLDARGDLDAATVDALLPLIGGLVPEDALPEQLRRVADVAEDADPSPRGC